MLNCVTFYSKSNSQATGFSDSFELISGMDNDTVQSNFFCAVNHFCLKSANMSAGICENIHKKSPCYNL